MTEEPVTLEELNAARETFIAEVVGKMPDAHRKFLVSFVRGTPDWASMGLTEAATIRSRRDARLSHQPAVAGFSTSIREGGLRCECLMRHGSLRAYRDGLRRRGRIGTKPENTMKS